MLADRQIAERGEVADRSWVGGDSQPALIDDQVDQRRAVGSCSDCQVIEHRLLPPLACCPLPTNQSDTVKPGQRKDVPERGNRRYTVNDHETGSAIVRAVRRTHAMAERTRAVV